MTTLFTIGYEKASQADVLAALQAAGVEILIDVRDRWCCLTPIPRDATYIPVGYTS